MAKKKVWSQKVQDFKCHGFRARSFHQIPQRNRQKPQTIGNGK